MPAPAYIDKLAADARPFDEVDWGSDRQIAAENRLFDEVEKLLANYRKFQELQAYCHKATVTEMIDAALNAVEGRPLHAHRG